MASAAVSSFLLPHVATLCPPPLHIEKKARRPTIRRRILRKSTRGHKHPVKGPLDDIIDEIRSGMWESPHDGCTDSSVLNWANPLKASSTWAVTPLPVSRAPSDQPLTIRKNRNSRSSASGSSMGDSKSYSRNNSQDEGPKGGAVSASLPPGTAPWPSFEPTSSTNASSTTIRRESDSARRSLESIIEGRPEAAVQRRTSRLRKFTSGFPRLRRTVTGETSFGSSEASEIVSSMTSSPPTGPDEATGPSSMDEPSDEAVEAYIKRNAHNCKRVRAIMERMAERLPSQVGDEHDLPDSQTLEADGMPTTLRAAIRMFPEAKILTKDQQEICVAVEVEGVLHNRSKLESVTVDVIFIVDNRDCLERATDAVNGALYHMRRGDRLALYTTHCAHNPVSGNKPELHYPIRPFSSDTEDLFAELNANICRCGTQVWEPARPNPSMTDVVLAVAKSLDGQDLKQGRTHIILLSPAAHVLHDVSRSFPDLYIHRINPAALPFRRDPQLQDTVCFESCCKNVFVSNWTSYQSIPGRVKRILKNARSNRPVGELTSVSIDVRTRDGCELIESFGSKEVLHLRLGEVHTFFVRIRVNRNQTQGVDLDSVNPVFNSSLDVKGLKQELQNAAAVGAMKVHVIDVQLYHHNSIHAVDCWNYNEAPLTLIRELGGLAPPIDTALEVYKREYFHKFIQLTTNQARVEADKLLSDHNEGSSLEICVLQRLANEIKCHEAIRKYERDCRQKLPMCPGPIDMEASHEWLLELWSKKKNKRNGVACVIDGTAGLIDSFTDLKHHG